MRIKRRTSRTVRGPLALNWSGWRPTSITLRLPFGHSAVLWERRR